ncbi:MAG: B12-binding domain-containing radical SAM protein [Chitinispirillaceae bacterium]|nr:B12-binding domain-containing radical SAM protein [Chitinispirillaceae bacterium]
MPKKILLINPVNPSRRGLTNSHVVVIPPLGLGIVAALTGPDWDLDILDENFDRFTYQDADLVAFSAFTPAAPRAYEIASLYRSMGIPTVIGGIHASMLPHEALRFVDTVAIGEAESTWPAILEDFSSGKLRRIYREDPARSTPINGARHDLFHSRYIMDAVQTARGCPMDCNFCSVTTFNGRAYRQRAVEAVLDELEAVPRNNLYLVDDNIYGYGPGARERALSLFRGIKQRGIRKDWMSQASINFVDNEDVLEAAAESGCRLIFLGLEASEDEALMDVNKRLNMRYVDRYEEAFRTFHKHGIAVFGGFIYGMESDTPESLARRTEFIRTSGVDAAQVSVMTPLPGTRLYARFEKECRLLYTDYPHDWTRYDMIEVVFKPKLMTPAELTAAFCDTGFVNYNPVQLLMKCFSTLSATKKAAPAWWSFSASLNYLCVGAVNYVQRNVAAVLKD